MRLIDVNDLWKCETCFHMQNGQCDGYCDHGELYRPAYSKLKIVDAAPVVHGHWIGGDYDKCSECGGIELGRTDYCPHCGAKMDGVSE